MGRVCQEALCRTAASPGLRLEPDSFIEVDYPDRDQALTGSSLWECPACHRGRMIVIAEIPPGSIPTITDTS
jgi:hypothetical protein